MIMHLVTVDTAEQAAFLADRQGNNFRLLARGKTIKFDDAAHAWFAGRPDTDDGHIDADGYLWLGSNRYPVRSGQLT